MIIERVVRAARRGVKVHIIARPPHTLKAEKLIEGVGGLRIMEDVGAKVHKLKGLRLHGKMLLADGARAIVGSVNLAPGSFDARRELAIEVDDAHVVEPLEKVAKHDWDHSEALDLTDDGPDGRPREARQGRRRRRPRARRGPVEGSQAPARTTDFAPDALSARRVPRGSATAVVRPCRASASASGACLELVPRVAACRCLWPARRAARAATNSSDAIGRRRSHA